MENHQLLLDIALVLLTARVFAELARKAGIPVIIGELVAGIVLGPSLFGWIQPSDALNLLAEIGIVLLLFEVGLETDMQRLAKAGPFATILALAGFLLPFVFGFACSYYLFDLSLLVSLFIAGALTATSIGITVRILNELGRQSSLEGQVVLGAAVVDDVLGVLLLAVLYDFATSGDVSPSNIGKIVLLLGGFLLLAPLLAKLFSTLLRKFHSISEIPGLIPVTLVAMVLLFGVLANSLGAPVLLGGFAAGIALSRRFFLPFAAAFHADPVFSQHIHTEMKPIIHLFTPIFFVVVGLNLDLSAVDWSSSFIWGLSISLTLFAIAGKVMAGWCVPGNMPMRTAIGMAMVPRGEVGLIFAELGRTSGIFDQQVYAAVIIVIAYTTLFSPIWIKNWYRRFGDKIDQSQLPGSSP